MLKAGVAVVVCVAALTSIAFVTSVVTYKPFGVPDVRREEYDAKVAQLTEHQKVAQTDRPQWKASGTVWDFGYSEPGQSMEHVFSIYNDGQVTLTLQRGFESPGIECQPKTADVPPGQSQKIRLVWDAKIQGTAEATVIYQTNDPLSREITLRVTAKERKPLIVPKKFDLGLYSPEKEIEVPFYVYSQTENDFSISSVSTPVNGVTFEIEGLAVFPAELSELAVKSAYRVTMRGQVADTTRWPSRVEIGCLLGDQEVQRTVEFVGKPKSAIVFEHPEIHVDSGFSLGTVLSDRDRTFAVTVRQRRKLDRPIEVLDVQPPFIRATLDPIENLPGVYRLAMTIPAGTPTTTFNNQKSQGYVKVGNADDDTLSDWLPITGAVVTQ